MAKFYKARPDAAAVLSTANGTRSIEQITVAESETPYESGSVLVDVDGVYTLVSAADLEPTVDGEETVPANPKLAVLVTRTVALDDDAHAVAVVRDAEVKGSELELPADIDLADVAPFLAAQGIVVR